MKRKFTILGIALVIAAAQFITYYTIADARLSKLVIKNLIVNTNYPSDTIVLSSLLSIYGDQENSIKSYDLHLSSKENSQLLKKKFAPSIIIDGADRTNNMNSNKPNLSIVGLEEHTFSVTVNTNYSYQSQFYCNEDHYIWALLTWIKI